MLKPSFVNLDLLHVCEKNWSPHSKMASSVLDQLQYSHFKERPRLPVAERLIPGRLSVNTKGLNESFAWFFEISQILRDEMSQNLTRKI